MANPPNKTQPPPLKPAANAYHLLQNESQTLVQPPNPPPVRGRPAPNPPVPVGPPVAYVTISGSTYENLDGPVIGLAVEVQSNGTIFSDGAGNYSIILLQGYSGSFVTHPVGNAFTIPQSRIYSNVQTNQVAQDFVVFNEYVVSGTLTQNGTGMGNVPVTFYNQVGTVYSNGFGVYSGSVVSGYSGSVTPMWFGGTFNPTFRFISNIHANTPNQNFQFFGTSAGASIHIAGTVTSNGTGIQASIEISGDGTVSTSTTGSYDFTVSSPFSGTTIPHVGVGTNGSFIPVDYVYSAISVNQTNQNFSFVVNADCPIPTTLAAIVVNGTAQPTIMASNPNTNEILVLDDNNPTVYFINALTNTVIQTLDTGNGAFIGSPCAHYDSVNNQYVVMTYNGDILFISPTVPHAVTGTIANLIRHPSFHMMAYDAATGTTFATSYRDVNFPNGLMRVINGATKSLVATGTNPVAPDAITWCPNVSRVYIGKVGIGAPLYTLFNPVGLSYTNAPTLTADTNFNYEVFFHPPTGYVLHSRDGSSQSRIVNVVAGTLVANFAPQRISDMVVNTCTGETWVSDGNSLIFELDTTGTLATVAAYSTKPNNLAFSRRTNLLYYDDYSTNQIITLPTTSQSDPFFGLDQYGFTTFGNMNGITSITFNNIISIPGFDIETNTELTSLFFPFLVYIDPNNFQSGYIFIDSCPNITTISLPVWMPTPGGSYSFTGLALNAASVNGILARGVANPSFTSGTMDLSGGTSSAPTGQGITDKATLIGRGVTVTTN